MRVLYVNHTGLMSGAERVLLAVLRALPPDVEPVVACPEGALEPAVRALGIPLERIRGTSGSLRLHPLHTSVALGELARDGLRIRRLAKRLDADVVHAISIRACLACLMAGRPVVVYVPDVLPPGRGTRLIRRLIGRRAAAVLPNSTYTQDAFVEPGFRARSRVVHPPVDLVRFDPSRVDRDEARSALGLGAATPALGVVAQLTPWKGQDVAIQAVARVREAHPDVQLLLVGSAKFASAATRYDNPAYVRSLEQLVRELDLGATVRFLGEREDVPAIVRALDVALVPSWEEPFGLSVAEAMAMEVPVVATSVGGPADQVVDGETGVLLPPRSPDLWADAIGRLLSDPDLRAGLAGRARERVIREFAPSRHVEALLAVYRGASARA